MKTFHCTHCQNLVFFENVRCLNCERSLAYLPDIAVMAAIQKTDADTWQATLPDNQTSAYRLCANYTDANVCNWAVAACDRESLCISCRLTRVIPNLAVPGNQAAWYRLEVAKRRLIYTLLMLRLPVSKRTDTAGLAFEFLEDSVTARGDRQRVFTGHDNGVITINLAEADDVQREQQRQQQNEPYRTLIGHFRHEIGHYYWDRLIQNGPLLAEFRELFGDERADYAEALQRHYTYGSPADWELNFISSYATMHPWEDWAESWAHFMHITDALETASAMGVSVKPRRDDEPTMRRPDNPLNALHDFNRLIEEWSALTYVLNNLNRSLGLQDSYPFVLSPPVIEKLRFVSRTVMNSVSV